MDALTKPPRHYLSLIFSCVHFILNMRFKKFQFEGRINNFETSNWGRYKAAIKSYICILHIHINIFIFYHTVITSILYWWETSGPEKHDIQWRVQSKSHQQKDGEGMPGLPNHCYLHGPGKPMLASLSIPIYSKFLE